MRPFTLSLLYHPVDYQLEPPEELPLLLPLLLPPPKEEPPEELLLLLRLDELGRLDEFEERPLFPSDQDEPNGFRLRPEGRVS